MTNILSHSEKVDELQTLKIFGSDEFRIITTGSMILQLK